MPYSFLQFALIKNESAFGFSLKKKKKTLTNNYRSTGMLQKISKDIPSTLHPVAFNGNISYIGCSIKTRKLTLVQSTDLIPISPVFHPGIGMCV